jgi:polyisoprenoid-binding protein YceI
MRKRLFSFIFISLCLLSSPAFAETEDYVIDTRGAHAFINFRTQHLGFSWILGDFKKFSGKFMYDEEDPSTANISLNIDVASINTNHAKRDKRLRSDDFFDVDQFPEATFTTLSFDEKTEKKAILKGELTLHGVTRPVTIDLEHIGHGPDPWGGYRRGFFGTTQLKPAEFGINMELLGPASQEVFLDLAIEGLRLNEIKKGKH